MVPPLVHSWRKQRSGLLCLILVVTGPGESPDVLRRNHYPTRSTQCQRGVAERRNAAGAFPRALENDQAIPPASWAISRKCPSWIKLIGQPRSCRRRRTAHCPSRLLSNGTLCIRERYLGARSKKRKIENKNKAPVGPSVHPLSGCRNVKCDTRQVKDGERSSVNVIENDSRNNYMV